jgi:hypothetical protein
MIKTGGLRRREGWTGQSEDYAQMEIIKRIETKESTYRSSIWYTITLINQIEN